MLKKAKRLLKRFLKPTILNVEELIVGKNVIIEPGVEINCKRLVLGDGVYIGSGTQIQMTDLVIGDYTKINNHCLLTGTDWCRIGHNCWFGHYTVIDSIGTTQIGHGVGVGAQSQLWSHIYFGDALEGCRFHNHQPLVIEDDVWFVGHCIVSPIHAKSRSMAMVGSVVTKNMEENHVYAGSPAKDMTDRFGSQFEPVSLEKKMVTMQAHLDEFLETYNPKRNRIEIVEQFDPTRQNVSQFSVKERQYIKNLYPEEVKFMRYLLPTKAKFIPQSKTDWVYPELSTTS
ncbi:MAG: hypothetical protein AB8G95_16825 [Anaerolineae bacterium]